MGNKVPQWHLEGKPFPVQKAALRARAKSVTERGRDKYGYFLEQGLGKTQLCLNDFVEALVNDTADLCLIWCMNSKKIDWKADAKEWAGLNLASWPNKMEPGDKGFIINYESMRASGGEYFRKAAEGKRIFLIIDESTCIKNPQSALTKIMFTMAPRCTGVRLASGTPYLLHVMDLFPQFRAIGELEGKNRFAFRNRFAVMGGFMGKKTVGIKNEDQLQQLLKSCSFRATKDDWTDIPKATYGVRRVQMNKDQIEAYKEMLEFCYLEIDGGECTAEQIITKYIKLQQIAMGFVYDDEKKTQWLVPSPGKNPKLQAILEAQKAHPQKTIITALYKPSVNLLLEALPKSAYIRGGMKMDEITEQKERFQNDPDCRDIILQLQSGSMGHTLLGGPGIDRCTLTLHGENSYSLLHRLQVVDRNRRFGQDQAQHHLDFVCCEQDKRVLANLVGKEKVADFVVNTLRSRPDPEFY